MVFYLLNMMWFASIGFLISLVYQFGLLKSPRRHALIASAVSTSLCAVASIPCGYLLRLYNV